VQFDGPPPSVTCDTSPLHVIFTVRPYSTPTAVVLQALPRRGAFRERVSHFWQSVALVLQAAAAFAVLRGVQVVLVVLRYGSARKVCLAVCKMVASGAATTCYALGTAAYGG
jgi:hypothetical protein